MTPTESDPIGLGTVGFDRVDHAMLASLEHIPMHQPLRPQASADGVAIACLDDGIQLKPPPDLASDNPEMSS